MNEKMRYIGYLICVTEIYWEKGLCVMTNSRHSKTMLILESDDSKESLSNDLTFIYLKRGVNFGVLKNYPAKRNRCTG